MGKYSGAREAKVLGSKHPNIGLALGKHRVKVLAIRDGDSPIDGMPWYAADLQVVSSNDATLKGRSFAWVTKKRSGKAAMGFLSDIKRFVGAMLTSDPELVGDSEIEASTSEEQPFTDTEIMVDVFEVPAKDPQPGKAQKWTRVMFSSVP